MSRFHYHEIMAKIKVHEGKKFEDNWILIVTDDELQNDKR